jgi:hypothetical protein
MSTPEQRAAAEKWRNANKEKVNAYQREYRKNNPDKVKASDQRKYQKNAEVIKEKERVKRTKPEYKLRKRQAVPSARRNATKRNVPFDLTREHIESIWPADNCCPIFGTPFTKAKAGETRDTSASLDRIQPTSGYVEGNIHVISMKANRIKTNATAEEIQQVANYFFSLRA